jgi:hypothetical protein
VAVENQTEEENWMMMQVLCRSHNINNNNMTGDPGMAELK